MLAVRNDSIKHIATNEGWVRWCDAAASAELASADLSDQRGARADLASRPNPAPAARLVRQGTTGSARTSARRQPSAARRAAAQSGTVGTRRTPHARDRCDAGADSTLACEASFTTADGVTARHRGSHAHPWRPPTPAAMAPASAACPTPGPVLPFDARFTRARRSLAWLGSHHWSQATRQTRLVRTDSSEPTRRKRLVGSGSSEAMPCGAPGARPWTRTNGRCESRDSAGHHGLGTRGSSS